MVRGGHRIYQSESSIEIYMNKNCERCQGTLYPRRCRSLPEVREAAGLPEVCPFGLPIVRVDRTIVREKGTIVRKMGTPDRRVDCRWGKRLSCCRIECHQALGIGLVFVNAHCKPAGCRYFETVEA